MGVEELKPVRGPVDQPQAIQVKVLSHHRYDAACVHGQLAVDEEPEVVGARELDELAGARLIGEFSADGVSEIVVARSPALPKSMPSMG